MNSRTKNIVKVAVVAMFAIAFSRCANIMTPQGGPKDTIPPVIVRLEPDNFTTHFDQKKIYIEFDEYVQIKDQQKELYVSPGMKKMPLVSTRGKGIAITIRDTLKENTTYALDFGSAIRDNNEGNPLNAMRYVFSTGDSVDSLMCSGYTADSYKADSVSRTFIWFFVADSLPNTPDYDSTIFNRKPDAIGRAQNNGIFIAQNLKPIPYRIYAIGDKNDNQLYEPGSDMVGILDSVYNPATLPDFAIWFDSLRLYPSAEPQLYFRMFTDVAFKGQRLAEQNRPLQKKAVLQFNSAYPKIEKIVFDSIPASKVLLDPITKGRDTINVWFNVPAENLPDTIKGEITYFKHDSIRQLISTTEKLKLEWHLVESKDEQRAREKEEKEKAKAEAEGREYTAPDKPNPFKFSCTAINEINPEKPITFTTDSPLIDFDSTKIEINRVDENGAVLGRQSCNFIRDTMSICRYEIRTKLDKATKYQLYIPKQIMTDIMGYQNDSIVQPFSTYDPDKFALVKINVSAKAGKKYILQLTDAQAKTIAEIKDVTDGEYNFNYIPAGEIRLRIIEDTNGNGSWDAGNVVQRLQPERAEMYANEKGEDLFVTKMNWEVELTLDMDKIFQPMTMKTLTKILDDKEASRLKKLEEELIKKQAENKGKNDQNDNQNNQGGMGFGGMMGGMSGGMGGMGGMMNGGMNTGRSF